VKVIDNIKAALRPTVVYKPFLTQKAKRQEQTFLTLRDKYYQKEPHIFGPPGYLEHSKTLLHQRWKGPKKVKESTRDVRLFVIEPPGIGGDCFESKLDRNFDVEVFSLSRHKLGFIRGESDLVAFSSGIDDCDRQRASCNLGRSWGEWRCKLQQDVLAAVDAAHGKCPIDLCFAYGGYSVFEPETLNAIREKGIPIALLCLDDKHVFLGRSSRFPSGQRPLIGSCDVHLTNSFECIRWYMAEGSAAFYFPQGIDPELYKPLDVKKDIPVSFMGKAYGSRFDFVRSLWKAGIPLSCFGPGWKEGIVKNHIEIYRRSIINLGVGATGFSERMSCVKGRDFEVPATGGFYLTTYDYELSRLFDIGKEIVCYHNVFDCVELIRYYLKNHDEANAIGLAARQRIVKQHTWTHRIAGLLQWMGILSKE